MGGGRTRARLAMLGGGAVVVALHALLVLRHLPGPGGALGHDWSFFLPQLLAGSYWMQQNGVLDVPWFTPAWLGGAPFHPDPQNLYWSLPQQLCRVVAPLTAVRWTFVACSAVAHAGTYLLLRRTFGLRRPAAALGAVLFAWNGYLAARFLIGHLVYHTFALLPLVAHWLLGRAGRRAVVLPGLGAGLGLAAMIHACDLHGLPVAGLAVLALWCLRAALGRPPAGVVARCAVAVGAAAALSASKLVAMGTFLAQFPRDGYPLPGAADVLGTLRLALFGVFGRAPVDVAADVLVNAPWAIERHELEYGVSPVAAAALLMGALVLWRRGRLPPLLPAAGLLLILGVPLALNVHDPAWERTLKAVPLLGSGTTLLRTLSLYIPLAAVVAALAVDRLAGGRRRGALLSALGVLAVLAWHATDDRSFYAAQSYRGARVAAAWDAARSDGPPPVTDLVMQHGPDGRTDFPVGRNEAFTAGGSALHAFVPIFGYRLEWLPPGTVRPGPALPEDGPPNVRDPSRFLWPALNGGPPGSSFDASRRDAVRAFLAYRPFSFERSRLQRVADRVSTAAALLVPVLLAVLGAGRALRR